MDDQTIGSSAYLVMDFRDIENLMPMKEPTDKTRMFWTLLKGQALSNIEHHLMRRLEAEDSDVPDNELIELVIRNVGLEYIPKHSIHVQKDDMRQPRGLYMGLNTFVQQFVVWQRLNDLNRYLYRGCMISTFTCFIFLKKNPSN
jgi:hypothetical protein